jgi:hypothetical protein
MGRHGHSAHKTALLKESWEDHKVSAVPGVHGRQPLAGHDFLRIDGIIPTPNNPDPNSPDPGKLNLLESFQLLGPETPPGVGPE